MENKISYTKKLGVKRLVRPEIPDLPRYTPKLNAALDDLIKVFSAMPCPPPKSFLYHDEYNQFGEYCPPNAKTIRAFDILSKRVPGVPVVNAENIFDLSPLMFHCEIDVIAWLIPQELTAARDWWLTMLEEDSRATKDYINGSLSPYGICRRREQSLHSFRCLVGRVSKLFCDTTRYDRSEDSDPCQYLLRMRIERAETFKKYLTPSMRRAIKRYLVLWYDVMGRAFYAQPMGGRVLCRQWPHNFCI